MIIRENGRHREESLRHVAEKLPRPGACTQIFILRKFTEKTKCC